MSKTLNEIKRIPDLLNKSAEITLQNYKEQKILFVGCGSSYNIGYTASEIYKNHGVTSNVVTAGKILTTGNYPSSSIAFLLSRTGESTETIEAAKILKKDGIKTVAITCDSKSPLVNQCDEDISFDFAYEESVVMTGSFIVILHSLLNIIKRVPLAEKSEFILKESKKLIDSLDHKKYNHFVFLGYDELYGLSKEGALKLQEMALQNVEFHEPLEYRHGPRSTLDEKTIIIIQSKDTKYERELANELSNSDAKVIYVGKDGDINIPYNDGFETPLRMIPVLIIGYKKAINMGLNPDKPKNLTKSVKI
ncbi:MAG: SIS domain-containing protein [Kosmotogaceae bacterium]